MELKCRGMSCTAKDHEWVEGTEDDSEVNKEGWLEKRRTEWRRLRREEEQKIKRKKREIARCITFSVRRELSLERLSSYGRSRLVGMHV